MSAMPCCGTNVVFRRKALEDVGGFPEHSVTEDFALSIELHARGRGPGDRSRSWEVLAVGLGPEDMASYVRAARNVVGQTACLGAVGRVMRSKLPAVVAGPPVPVVWRATSCPVGR